MLWALFWVSGLAYKRTVILSEFDLFVIFEVCNVERKLLPDMTKNVLLLRTTFRYLL